MYLYGVSGHAKVIIDILKSQNKLYESLTFIVCILTILLIYKLKINELQI